MSNVDQRHLSETLNSQETIDHLFRREYGRLVAILSSRFSNQYIDEIEDAVQEAMYKALSIWRFRELPHNPGGWLLRVAQNELLDRLRRLQRAPLVDAESHRFHDPETWESVEFSEIEDDTLRMLFACCHPEMTEAEQTMLCLKLLCGFGVKEIAAALLKKPGAIKRALTRAKHKFRKQVGELSVPEGTSLSSRLADVMRVLYLMFNEGYKSAQGNDLIHREMSEEAFRLGTMLYQSEHCRTADLKALLALMCYNSARFPARVSSDGQLLTLAHQDRTLWDKDAIRIGELFFHDAIEGVRISRYHLEAGIARCHIVAPSFDETDWESILKLYDLLAKIEKSPVVALNRIVAVLHSRGPDEALAELRALEDSRDLSYDYLFHSIAAEILQARGEAPATIQAHMEAAIELCTNSVERRFLQIKMERVLPDLVT